MDALNTILRLGRLSGFSADAAAGMCLLLLALVVVRSAIRTLGQGLALLNAWRLRIRVHHPRARARRS
jgi:hypothetical protein